MRPERSRSGGAKRGTRGRRRWGCFTPLAVLVLLILFMPRILEGYAHWLIIDEPLERSDAIVTLAGGDGERLFASLRLYNEKAAPNLLIVGPDETLLKVYTQEDSLTQGEIKRRIAIRRGVPEGAIVLALGATSTFEEAETTLATAREHGWESITIVTSPFHTRRARATFRKVLRDDGIRVSVSHLPVDLSQSDPNRWWRREHDTMAIFSETVKMGYYAYRYRIWPWS